MISYLEEKAFREATAKLLQVKLISESQLIDVEAWLDNQENLSLEEKQNIANQAMEYYDLAMIPAEKEYDKTINKIFGWKKIRKQALEKT